MKKNYVALELIIEGSRQEYLELSKTDLKNVLTSFLSLDGNNHPKNSKTRSKFKKLLKRWEDEDKL